MAVGIRCYIRLLSGVHQAAHLRLPRTYERIPTREGDEPPDILTAVSLMLLRQVDQLLPLPWKSETITEQDTGESRDVYTNEYTEEG